MEQPYSNPGQKLSDTKVLEYQNAVVEAFRAEAPSLLEHAGRVTHSTKWDNSPVTEFDKQVEENVKAALQEKYPHIAVYGEEGEYDQSQLNGVFCVVDPIDGTKSFIRGVPSFTSMAVLFEGATALASVIYDPSTAVAYTARRGQGAYKNGKRIDLNQTLMPKEAHCSKRFAEPLGSLMRAANLVLVQASPGVGHHFTRILDGTLAARFTLGGNGQLHDYAPGVLLVEEAGGSIIPVDSTEYTPGGANFVACHPALRDMVLGRRSGLQRLIA